MEINENNFQLLAGYLQKTWDADANIRKPGNTNFCQVLRLSIYFEIVIFS